MGKKRAYIGAGISIFVGFNEFGNIRHRQKIQYHASLNAKHALQKIAQVLFTSKVLQIVQSVFDLKEYSLCNLRNMTI